MAVFCANRAHQQRGLVLRPDAKLKWLYYPVVCHVGQHLWLDDDLSHRILRVLRWRVGKQWVMMDGQGQCATVAITDIRAKQVGIEVMAIAHMPKPSAHIAVAVPICARQTMAQLFDQGTQMGCRAFYPTIYAHSRSTGQHKHIDTKSQQRWQTIIAHAAEQSEQAWLPELATLMDLETLCAQTAAMQKIELGFANAMSPSTLQTLRAQPVLLCLGPEGGLTQEESDHIRAQGGQCLRLPGGILRVETALVAALATLQAP